MRERTGPTFEYDRDPALWGGATALALGIAVLFVLHRPGWLLPVGLAAGGVAGARSGFYAQSATNGLVAVAFGLVALAPVAFCYRIGLHSGTGDVVDLAFVGAALTAVDLLAYGPPMLVFGYLGAAIVDVVRRRSDGRIGY